MAGELERRDGGRRGRRPPVGRRPRRSRARPPARAADPADHRRRPRRRCPGGPDRPLPRRRRRRARPATSSCATCRPCGPHYGGLSGDELADALVRQASRATAGVGAAGGALAAVQHAAPPSLVVAPVQLAAETVAVVVTELKLVAELHVVVRPRARRARPGARGGLPARLGDAHARRPVRRRRPTSAPSSAPPPASSCAAGWPAAWRATPPRWRRSSPARSPAPSSTAARRARSASSSRARPAPPLTSRRLGTAVLRRGADVAPAAGDGHRLAVRREQRGPAAAGRVGQGCAPGRAVGSASSTAVSGDSSATRSRQASGSGPCAPTSSRSRAAAERRELAGGDDERVEPPAAPVADRLRRAGGPHRRRRPHRDAQPLAAQAGEQRGRRRRGRRRRRARHRSRRTSAASTRRRAGAVGTSRHLEPGVGRVPAAAGDAPGRAARAPRPAPPARGADARGTTASTGAAPRTRRDPGGLRRRQRRRAVDDDQPGVRQRLRRGRRCAKTNSGGAPPRPSRRGRPRRRPGDRRRPVAGHLDHARRGRHAPRARAARPVPTAGSPTACGRA